MIDTQITRADSLSDIGGYLQRYSSFDRENILSNLGATEKSTFWLLDNSLYIFCNSNGSNNINKSIISHLKENNYSAIWLHPSNINILPEFDEILDRYFRIDTFGTKSVSPVAVKENRLNNYRFVISTENDSKITSDLIDLGLYTYYQPFSGTTGSVSKRQVEKFLDFKASRRLLLYLNDVLLGHAAIISDPYLAMHHQLRGIKSIIDAYFIHPSVPKHIRAYFHASAQNEFALAHAPISVGHISVNAKAKKLYEKLGFNKYLYSRFIRKLDLESKDNAI